MKNLIKTIKKFVAAQSWFNEPKKLLVAVSGGPDSIALLHVLERMKNQFGLQLIVGHFDHCLRSNSWEDAAFVSQLSQQLGLDMFSEKCDVAKCAKIYKMSIEECGRKLRYEFLFEILEQEGADYIATAHHIDDSIETFFLRLLQGSTITGLKGISSHFGKVIRPFSSITKKQITQYLQENSLAFRTDPTNTVPNTDRNYLRNIILPAIEQRFPAYRNTIGRTLSLLQIEEDTLERLTRQTFPDSGDSNLSFNRIELIGEPELGLRRLRSAIYEYSVSPIRLGNKHFQSMRSLIETSGSGQIHLPNGIRIVKQYDIINISYEQVKPQYDFIVPLDSLGTLELPNGLGTIRTEILEREEIDFKKIGLDVVYFDANIITLPLSVRTFRPGDRIHPWGLHGTKKVKKLFIDVKIPKQSRCCVPIITHRDDILWVTGLRRSRLGPITEQTKEVLKINFFR